MTAIHKSLSDTHILGADTEITVVCVEGADTRAWLKGSPLCPLLAQLNIVHTGIMVARPPFEVVRTDQSGTFFLACFGGSGMILADGGWKPVKAGGGCMLPPHTVNALKVGRNSHWSFAWVRYLEPPGVTPVASARSPTLENFDPEPLRHAIAGLHGETAGQSGSPAIQHRWVELIHAYVLRFATPAHTDDRVWKAWEKVGNNLEAAWTLDRIARVAKMSPEHFRRLCQKALRRSPGKHLTYLRMRRAAELLTTTDDKVETVAGHVGYANPFAFSNTFLKWIGVRPSEHRTGKGRKALSTRAAESLPEGAAPGDALRAGRSASHPRAATNRQPDKNTRPHPLPCGKPPSP